MSKFKVGDKVRVIDSVPASRCGKNSYFDSTVEKYLGKIATIIDIDSDGDLILSIHPNNLFFDESWVVQVREFIVIRRDGAKTIAELRHDREVIKSAVATCSEKDTFDFETGAKLAFDRLMGRGEQSSLSPADIFFAFTGRPAPEPPKFYTGKVVCIESDIQSRVGIVASIEDGRCSRYGWNRLSNIPYKSFDDFSSAWIGSKFVEVKE